MAVNGVETVLMLSTVKTCPCFSLLLSVFLMIFLCDDTFESLFLFYVCEYFACMYVCVSYFALTGPKRVPELLELEFQMFVSHHVGAGNRTWVLCKSSQCS